MMKRFSLQLLALIVAMGFLFSVAAQDAPSAGPVPNTGEGSTNFTGNNFLPDATIGYGYAGVTLLGMVDIAIPSGTVTLNMAHPGFAGFASSMCKGGDGVYYLTESGPPDNLHTFDPGTGLTTIVGPITGIPGGVQGIAYNPSNDTYYLLASDELFTFDVGTLVATSVGPTGVPANLMIDLCFDAAGNCWAYGLVDDNAYTLDPSTGTATLLGPLGFDANFGQGMAYDRESGTIYLSAFNNGTFTGQLRTMDPGTGATTMVTDWGFEQIAPFALDTFVPVELSSFGASVSGNDVTLNWTTATETNNSGFEVERKLDGNYEVVGFIAGFGTTTETKSYVFADENLQAGTYTYRLKQIDLDGTFEYSEEIEVDVIAPAEFSLNQNYPNPFNPSTKITFALAEESNVTLSIFNVLGEEVTTILNTDLAAGEHEVDFNAAGLNSGVYFYQISATANSGKEFKSVKKMILTK